MHFLGLCGEYHPSVLTTILPYEIHPHISDTINLIKYNVHRFRQKFN